MEPWEGLGALVDEKLSMIQQRALTAQKAKKYPGLHQKKSDPDVKGGDSHSLPCSCETPQGVMSPFWGPTHMRDMDLLERGHEDGQGV